MSEEPKRLEEPMFNDKKWGIIIILVAIALIVLTVCTNFFSGLSAFGPEEDIIASGETVTEENNQEEVVKTEENVVVEQPEETPSFESGEQSGD